MRQRQRGGSEGKGQHGRLQRRMGAAALALAFGWGASASPAQQPATQQTVEVEKVSDSVRKAHDVYPLAPTESPSDVEGELQTVTPQTGALVDWGIEELFPQSWTDWRQEMKDRYGFEFGFA